jgi:threonine/homoserine/homoserine lactone efflux protein
MDLHTWLIYTLAALGLSLSPGPNSLLVLAHGALWGPRRTLSTIAGGAVGFVALYALSMFGIGALLQASVSALVAMKWMGGAYLAWLGVQVWRAPPIGVDLLDRGNAPHAGAGPSSVTPATGPSAAALARQGLLAAATNPKGILFLAAFLPQFVDPARSLWLQFLVMAGTFVVIEFAVELFIAGAAHRIRPWLARVGRRFNQVCGGVFIAIGLALPLRG